MENNPETLYRQLGRLIETMPQFSNTGFLTTEQHRWLGLADALVMIGGDLTDQASWRAETSRLHTAARMWALDALRNILYRVLASAELKAPPSAQGAFIPVGNSFDAFASLSKLLGAAKQDVLIVDPYLDESALTEFGCAVPEGVSLRLLADQASCKSSLYPATAKWVEQYGATRPLFVRLSQPKRLHDRAIFIDHTQAWILTQSLKDFAKKSPAEIVRADDTAPMKIAAYQDIWDESQES
jgi:hypothetical protein